LITHPARYCSRAAEAFRKEVLPVFASPDSPLRQGGGASRADSSGAVG
jgi:hypothetical protein